MNQIKHVRLDKIKPPEFDHRLTDNPEADSSLCESIKELGVLEPILVKEVPDGFEIIAGHRRFVQAGRAGLAAIPIIICKTTGAASDKIALHENIHRLDLSHVDQAYTFQHLIKKYKITETQVATLVGKSLPYVSQHLCLLQCEDDLVQAVHDGRINFTVARELMHCKNSDERKRFQSHAENNGATSSVVSNWVKESNRESDLVDGAVLEKNPIPTSSQPQIPLYPCNACEVPTSIMEMKTVKLCPECHHLIFSEIEHQKFIQRQNLANQQP